MNEEYGRLKILIIITFYKIFLKKMEEMNGRYKKIFLKY